MSTRRFAAFLALAYLAWLSVILIASTLVT
jgi:hypothetical protein